MNVSRLLVPAFVVLAGTALPAPVLAQEASPAAGTAAARMTCTARPRDIGEALALWFNAEGTPVATPTMTAPVTDTAALPQGSPADEATVKAITETTQNWVECTVVEGQYARGFSYMTDNGIAQFGPDVTNPSEDTPEEVRALLEGQLAGTPVAGAEGSGQMPSLTGPRDARVLADGRAGAIWTFEGDEVFLVYKQQDGRWLIDGVIDIVENGATPTP